MNGSSAKNNYLPGEYRKAAERLFPKDGFSRGNKIEIKAAVEFAKALGIGMEYQRLLTLDNKSSEIQFFLAQFQNNIELLIQKTWVDKHEEKRKNKLQDEIPLFMNTLKKCDFSLAVDEFAAILNELAYLFFGIQSEKDDFTEYTFRIDAQMGLFWWYSGRFELLNQKIKDRHDDKILWAVLLLGICYLTNF
ncbi:MAG: hypothetical protein FWC19_03185 [Treponema sp.]|nr:hypothetical protein [Treponema sp.]MCL2271794.1 hypothetical protein [Treponema sp.]